MRHPAPTAAGQAPTSDGAAPQRLQRLLAWPGLAAEHRQRLQQLQSKLDPIALTESANHQLQQIRRQLPEGRRHSA